MCGQDLEELRETFVAFRDQCIELRNAQKIFEHLFESGDDTLKLLEDTAPLFFFDVQNILIEHIYLKACRLTDVASVKRGKEVRRNLTVPHLRNRLHDVELLSGEIIALADALQTYGDMLRAPRNRRIAHADLRAVLNDEDRGEHDEKDYQAFFRDLQEFCDHVGVALNEGPLDFRVVPGPGDVIDLLRVLERGKYRGR